MSYFDVAVEIFSGDGRVILYIFIIGVSVPLLKMILELFDQNKYAVLLSLAGILVCMLKVYGTLWNVVTKAVSFMGVHM